MILAQYRLYGGAIFHTQADRSAGPDARAAGLLPEQSVGIIGRIW